MNKSSLLGAVTSYLLVASLSVNAASFIISPPLETDETSNSGGLAVNPVNENVFLTTDSPPEFLPPGGADNLWEFTSSGDLVNSNRTIYDGYLGSMTFGSDGHLFIEATYSRVSPLFVSRDIIEMSQDGYTIYSSFSTNQYFGGTFGVTYNSIDDLLVVATGQVGTEYILREFTTDGTLINSFEIDENLWSAGLAFDAATGNLFSLRGSSRFQLLDEFTRTPQGEYQLINTYDLTSIGMARHGWAIDISRTTGLFYVNDNHATVLVFDRSELSSVPTHPYAPPDIDLGEGKEVSWIKGCGKAKDAAMVYGIQFRPLGKWTLTDSNGTYSGKYEWITEGKKLSLSLNKRSRSRLWGHIKNAGSSLCRADGKLKSRKIDKFIVKYDDPTAIKLIAKFKFRDATGARKGKYKVVVDADD
ncbi:MAG: hypothetical protein DRR42_20615 [Gammaproteobacteria bacterium]|nr:MAG: hypothetical protein DRR42_20615 [Gammaproteobacteria bacterium]